MLSLRKINPMARAIGTMGVVAGLVGAVTFAQITSNPVALADNTLSTATAALAIGGDHTCASGTSTTAVPGMTFSNLQPGVASSAFPFCLDNTGNVPLNLAASVPTTLTGSSINPNDVSLHFTCGVGGATVGSVDLTTTVGALNGGAVAFGNAALNSATNNILSCDVTATLNPAATFTSKQSLTPFDVQFVGTSTNTATPAVFDNSQIPA